MSLELQLSTAKAQKALDQFERSLGNVQKRLTSLNSAMATTRGVATSMNSGLSKAANSFNKAANSAKKAGVSMGSFRTQSAQAATATRAFASTAGSLRNVLAGLGIAMGGLAIGRMVKGMYDLNNSMTRIKILFDNTSDGMKNGERSMAFLRKTARDTALQIDVLAQSWSTFGFNVVESGFHIDQAEKMFTTLSATMRVLNLSAEQSKRTFQGFQQIVTKGSFSMEEIKQQIGENVPALKALERAVGVSGKELQKMLKEGRVGLEHLMPLMEQFNQQYARLLPESMNTTMAAFDSLRNEMKFFGEDLSKGAFDALAEPVRNLAKAIREITENNPEAIKKMGESIGKSLGAIVDGITWVVKNAELLWSVWVKISYVITAIVAVKLFAWLGTVADASLVAAGGAMQAARAWMFYMGVMIQTQGVIGTIRIALGLLWAAMLPFVGTAALIAGAVAAFLLLADALELGGVWGKIFGEAILWIGKQLGYTQDEIAIFMNYLRSFFDAAAWVEYLNRKLADLLKWLGYNHAEAEVLARYISGGFKTAWDYSLGAIIKGVSYLYDQIKGLIQIVLRAIGVLDKMTSSANAAASAASKAQAAGGGGGGGGATEYSTGTTSSGETIGGNSRLMEKYKDLPWVSGQHSTTISVPSGRIGGLTSKMGTRNPHAMVPASAFVGAPMFKNGGVTGGTGQSGIPAILHPNEAVIPLQNGKVPVAINGSGDIGSAVAQAIQQVSASGNLGGKTLTIKGSRGTETISMSQLEDLQEFIAFGQQWARARRQRQANKWDLSASYMLTAYQNTAEKHAYKGFTTKGGGMSGGDGKTYSVPKNFGADKRLGSVGGGGSGSGGGATGFGSITGGGKYGDSVAVLNTGAGWSSGNMVSYIPGAYLNPQYYQDIRPDFDYAGNTGLGWDIPAGYSMKHYKAAFGAALMGVPLASLPGATPGGMVHRNAIPGLDDGTQTRIGMAQMSQGAAYAGLAMWKAMKSQGGGTFDTSIAKAYSLGKKDALNPPGIRKLKMGKLTGIEKAVRAGKTIETFMQEKGIKEYIKTQGGYAKNPRYAQVMQEWAAAAEKLTDWTKGGSMDAGANISNLGEGVSSRGMFGSYLPVTDAMAQQFGMKNAEEAQKAMRDFQKSGQGAKLTAGLATGTANTSNDPRFKNAPAVGDGRGGRLVTIHPNEAVIPLKNGAVPIKIGSSAMGNSFGGNTGSGSSGGGGNVVVHMNIQATDVESFRRTEKQLVQDLTVKMRRAKQQIGTPAGEDLTKVVSAPPRKL